MSNDKFNTAMTELADAVRVKCGISGNLSIDDMISAISALSSGSGGKIPDDWINRTATSVSIPEGVSGIMVGYAGFNHTFLELNNVTTINIPSTMSHVVSNHMFSYDDMPNLKTINFNFKENEKSGDWDELLTWIEEEHPGIVYNFKKSNAN